MKTFEFSTIKDFDCHISASITGYNLLHRLIVNISSFFIKKNTIPIDLGCTSGKLAIAINEAYEVPVIGFDITGTNFFEARPESVRLEVEDITSKEFSVQETDLIFSIFTLQFLPIPERLPLLAKCVKSLNEGGAMIVCEKEICRDGVTQEVFTFSNYQNKRQVFSEKEILDKEEILRHTMTNLTSAQNEKLFRSAGFKVIEPFFQSLNFKGYILRK